MHRKVEAMNRPAAQISAADSLLPAGLGFDAGGTRTRWALVDRAGAMLAEVSVNNSGGGLAPPRLTQAESDSGRASANKPVFIRINPPIAADFPCFMACNPAASAR